MTGRSKTRRMQEAFRDHPRHLGRTYPAERHKRVVLIIDNAPWHRGGPIEQALADHSHVKFKRLPSYSPQLNVIERFWRWLRRRASHNRLFEPSRLEAVDPSQPLLLPDGARTAPTAGRQVLHLPRKPDSINGLVNEEPNPAIDIPRFA